MDYKGKIQYVRYYSAGSAAQKLELREQKKAGAKVPRAVSRPVHKTALQIDPFAWIGTAVAVVMILCVLAGFWQVNETNRQTAQVQRQIQVLQQENRDLQKAYEAGYDLEEIRTAADAMGLVPIEQVEHIRVSIQEPVEVPQPTFWQQLWQSFRELFA